MTLDESLVIVDKYVQAGWHIDYEIVDQYDNGYRDQVEKGYMSAYTYTPYVVKPKEEDYIEELCVSFNTLSTMYKWLGEKLNKIEY